ncbi:MAG: hypothetical protein WC531_00995 [Candidatus Paceibacterota bacterium]|jgi:hypothetical protein
MKKETKKVTLESIAKTIEKLASSTARGFEDGEKESKKRFEALNNRFQEVFSELSSIRADVRDVKGTLGPLTRAVSIQNEEIIDLHLRVAIIERKVGIERKKVSF